VAGSDQAGSQVAAPASTDPASADQATRLDAILNWLATGRMTTEQAVARVRTLHFPPAPEHGVGARMTADAHGEVPVPPPGSFHEVAAAYAAGRITRPQYAALAEAATASMRRDGSA
jgi:hypothetical protein